MDLFYRESLENVTDSKTGKKMILLLPWFGVAEKQWFGIVKKRKEFRQNTELRYATMLEF